MTLLDAPGMALVTGASSGIGAEFARQLAGRGHPVVIVARRGDRLEKLAAELAETGTGVEVIVADLTRSYDAGLVAERVGRPDVTVLVNCAGINGYGPFADADPSVIADVISRTRPTWENCVHTARGEFTAMTGSHTSTLNPGPRWGTSVSRPRRRLVGCTRERDRIPVTCGVAPSQLEQPTPSAQSARLSDGGGLLDL